MKKLFIAAVAILTLTQNANAIMCSMGCTQNACKTMKTFTDCVNTCYATKPDSIKNCIASAKQQDWFSDWQMEHPEFDNDGDNAGQNSSQNNLPAFAPRPQATSASTNPATTPSPQASAAPTQSQPPFAQVKANLQGALKAGKIQAALQNAVNNNQFPPRSPCALDARTYECQCTQLQVNCGG